MVKQVITPLNDTLIPGISCRSTPQEIRDRKIIAFLQTPIHVQRRSNPRSLVASIFLRIN